MRRFSFRCRRQDNQVINLNQRRVFSVLDVRCSYVRTYGQPASAADDSDSLVRGRTSSAHRVMTIWRGQKGRSVGPVPARSPGRLIAPARPAGRLFHGRAAVP